MKKTNPTIDCVNAPTVRGGMVVAPLIIPTLLEYAIGYGIRIAVTNAIKNNSSKSGKMKH